MNEAGDGGSSQRKGSRVAAGDRDVVSGSQAVISGRQTGCRHHAEVRTLLMEHGEGFMMP